MSITSAEEAQLIARSGGMGLVSTAAAPASMGAKTAITQSLWAGID